ncbi:MAG: putative RNA 2'-phosphotransferase [Saprospiraceae bacterium]|jgi:putative RNA 2'-phosphotransferase
MKDQIKKYSKFLSLLLRHKPETVGLKLDPKGWAETSELFQKVNQTGRQITPELLEQIVEQNDKKRFVFNEDKSRIRAAQGHSLKVELDYKACTPPDILYHGTIAKTAKLIEQSGIKKMNRHQVHLSADIETATIVAVRRGKPLILIVDAHKMHNEGYEFFQSDNGVWLTDFVPTEYIQFS